MKKSNVHSSLFTSSFALISLALAIPRVADANECPTSNGVTDLSATFGECYEYLIQGYDTNVTDYDRCNQKHPLKTMIPFWKDMSGNIVEDSVIHNGDWLVINGVINKDERFFARLNSSTGNSPTGALYTGVPYPSATLSGTSTDADWILALKQDRFTRTWIVDGVETTTIENWDLNYGSYADPQLGLEYLSDGTLRIGLYTFPTTGLYYEFECPIDELYGWEAIAESTALQSAPPDSIQVHAFSDASGDITFPVGVTLMGKLPINDSGKTIRSSQYPYGITQGTTTDWNTAISIPNGNQFHFLHNHSEILL